MDNQIKDFDVLLAPALKGKEIQSYTTRRLIGPGDNYGSVMLAVDVKLKNCNEELHLVAKLCPPTEFIKNMFNIPISYKKEVGFYSTIIPTLQEFQRARGCKEVIDFVPKYYGSRISVDPAATEVDDDACLVLENIKVNGFDIGDRLKGFDLQTAEYLIKDLAAFHAVPIALKMIDPERFQAKIMPYLPNHVNEQTLGESMTTSIINNILECAKKNLKCAEYLKRIEARLWENSEYLISRAGDQDGLFATILHNDLWVNNTMLRYAAGKPVKNAMVDFQTITYGNLAHDLLFFIYSSLSNEIITEHYDKLINMYYEHFIKVLTDLKINTAVFTFKNFLKKIDQAARQLQFFHIMFMLKPMLAEKSAVKELSDMNEDEFAETESVSEGYYLKLWFTILDFVDKGWI